MKIDFTAKLNEARQRLPLMQLMEQRGRGPANGNWKSFPECPYCKHTGSAGVFSGDRGVDLFKCHYSDCPTAGKAFDGVGFLGYELGLSDHKEASIALMKEAGLWQEMENNATSVLPGQMRSGSEESGPPISDKVVLLNGGDTTNETKALPDETKRNDDEPPVTLSLEALRWFYDQLTLSDKDRVELFGKRGLVDETIDMFGSRSNPQSNKELLLEMERHFPIDVLMDCGLWKIDDDNVNEPPKPNAQYYGMSIREKRDAKTGEKIRDAKKKPMLEFEWDNPILIPYFNERGDLIHLRPHKGMMRDKAPHFYVARPAKAYLEKFRARCGLPQFAAVSEGEFKSQAQWQVVGDIAVCASVPGITTAKPLFGAIEEWVESSGVKQVIVGFDSEEKGDPKLRHSYQKDEWRRHDTPAWMLWLAQEVTKHGYNGMVCVLPKNWRDAKGKADWDGRLAFHIQSEIGNRKSEIGTRTADEIWEKVKVKVRSEFLGVLKKSFPANKIWQAGMFDRVELRAIHNKLERISYEPCLPVGDEEEENISKKFLRLAMKLKKSDWFPTRLCGQLFMMAEAYKSVSGRYFVMKPLGDKQDKKIDEWQKQMDVAKSRGDEDAKRAIEMVLRGKKTLGVKGYIPRAVSDFYLKPQYVLHKITGEHLRLATLHNVHHVNTKMLVLPPKPFSSPTEFRVWALANCMGGAWNGGQNELSALHEDFNHYLARKEVYEVPLRGYYKKSGMWFFEDWCIGDGEEFTPNEDTGIFWVERNKLTQGYTFARDSEGVARDREGEVFRQGLPHMHPEAEGKPKDSKDDVRSIFEEVVKKLPESLGGMVAFMALGLTFSIAAGPEFYRKYSNFPGLWVHGEQGKGKSSLVRWLIRIWGFDTEKGLPLPAAEKSGTVTTAALACALGQFGELQLWLEEYQSTSPEWVQGVLKNTYDRMAGGKKDFGASPREFLASVIVSGVATSSDAQTRERFGHVHVTDQGRQADHHQWFQVNSREFYRLGRFLLRNRKQYVEKLMAHFHEWDKSPLTRGVSDRSRTVHGLAYAGFVAAAELLGTELDMAAYQSWMLEHCRQSATEVRESVNVDMFWRDVLNANESNAFGEDPSDRRKVFNAQLHEGANPPVSEYQIKHGAEYGYTEWKSYLLYFLPGAVLEMLRKEKRKSGGNFPGQLSDLRNQMKGRPYWVEPESKQGHKQKFNGSSKSCWCIRVDEHDLGFTRISDDEFKASMQRPGQQSVFLGGEEWTDPRKGDLFGLIESLNNKRDDNKSDKL